jgi:hypothetical protein
MLYGLSPASQFFSHNFWKSRPFDLGKKVKGIS